MTEDSTVAKNRSLDSWWESSNYLFFLYIRKRLAEAPHAWGRFHRTADRTTPQAHSTRLALRHKTAWAEEMAEFENHPSGSYAKQRWKAQMAAAETEITRHLSALKESS